MSWESRLGVASFHGIRFRTESVGFDTGRRFATHELYKSDTVVRQDLGRKRRQYNIIGYIFADADNNNDPHAVFLRLQQVVESGRAAAFRHPYFGLINDTVCTEIKQADTRQEGGIVRFSAVFLSEREAQAIIRPSLDIQESLRAKAGALADRAETIYVMDSPTAPTESFLDNFIDSVTGATDIIRNARVSFGGESENLWQNFSRISKPLRNLVSATRGRITDATLLARDTRTIISGITSGDKRRVLDVLLNLDSFFVKDIAGLSPALQDSINAQRRRFTFFANRIAFSEIGNLLADNDLGDLVGDSTEGEIYQMRLTTGADKILDDADSESDIETYNAVRDLQTDFANYFSEQLPALPRIVEFRSSATSPLLNTANHFTPNNSETVANDIERRNKVFFPLQPDEVVVEVVV